MNKQLLSLTQWRLVLVLLALAVLACSIWGTTYWRRMGDPEVAGTMGIQYGQPDAEFRRPIITITDDSPFASAGAKVGDKVGFDRLSDNSRVFGMEEVFGVTLLSNGRATHLLVRPIPAVNVVRSPVSATLKVIASWASAYLTLVIALLIGWRRADSNAMRAFALVLMAWTCNTSFLFVPAGAISMFLFQVGGPVISGIVVVCFMYFALAFPEERPLFQRTWIRRAFYCFAGAFGIVIAGAMAHRSGILPGGDWRAMLESSLPQVFAFVSVVCSLAALWYSWRTSEGRVRQRVAWVGACMGVIYATLPLSIAIAAAGVPVPGYAISFIRTMIIFVAYVGLAYALLRHRLFDFGFAVNRALVFTIISTMLLVVFSVSEWAVDKLLHFHGRETSAILDAVIALVVILSFHRIQHWVRHRVDHTFYHHWYDAAARLRDFLEKAPHIASAAALEHKFIAAIEQFCGAGGVAVYVPDDGRGYRLSQSTMEGAPASIDADDDTVIDMRHSHRTVELADRGAALPGELALPMMVRGQVNGLVLVGAKAGGTGFRPDQVELIATAVHQFGHDLESLRIEQLQRRNVELEEAARFSELARNNAEMRAENLGMKLEHAMLLKV